MGLQKYRFDETGEPNKNGSVPVYSRWMAGLTLAAIRNCPCDSGISARTVYLDSEPDTFFLIPASVRVRRKRVRGFVTSDKDNEDDNGYKFIAYKEPG